MLHVHATSYRYTGDASAIYRDLVANHARTTQVITDVAAALARGRHCLVLTQWTAHVDALTTALRDHGSTR